MQNFNTQKYNFEKVENLINITVKSISAMLFLPLKFITYHRSLFRLQAKCSTENCTIVNDIFYYTRKIAPIHNIHSPT